MAREVLPGQVIGRPGRSLDNADSWASASKGAQKAGQVAEERTGEEITGLTQRGPSILHDLRIPIPGFNSNIDHVVVYGRTVLILDSKSWAPGVYWTWRGKTRRGFAVLPETPDAVPRTLIGLHVPHCDKQTLPMARDAVRRYLSSRGIDANVPDPMLVVWSSKKSNFLLYRPKGGSKVVAGERIGAWLRRRTPQKNASGDLLVALAELAN